MTGLSGWQRLWVVFCALTFIPAAAIMYEAAGPVARVEVLGGWAAMCAFVYALGAAIGWVWRGFFPRRST